MRGESHAAEFARQRSQDGALNPVVDTDKRAFPAAADHGNEHRDYACGNDHDESVAGQRAVLYPHDRCRDRAQRSGVDGDHRGRPAAASCAGQQRARGQQAEKTGAVCDGNSRYRDRGVQYEDHPQPDRWTTYRSGCTPQ